MASILLNLTAILSLITFSSSFFLSHNVVNGNDDEYHVAEYVIDTAPVFTTSSKHKKPRSPFLKKVIKKGAHCHPIARNICNGVSANNGTSLLYCCKKHCRNVLGDRNNCGRCAHKCGLGMRCCHGTCTNISHNATHCGKCDRRCAPGVKCEYGFCGYA
ncbi:hypothetical protein Ancab_004290 [Ancistrocladus abbreviatus]